MDEYTGLHIAVWIDMAVVSAACDTSAHIFSIVLEIEGKDRFSALHGTDFTNTVIHIFSLVRI